MECYHSGGVRQGEKLIDRWLLVKVLIQLKDCIQSKLLTLDLTICGEFWLLGQKVTVDK